MFTQCLSLAEHDSQLSEADRKALAQTYADRAVATLRQAVKNGYKKVAHMKKDTDLDPLRSHAEFQKLLKELENATPANHAGPSPLPTQPRRQQSRRRGLGRRLCGDFSHTTLGSGAATRPRRAGWRRGPQPASLSQLRPDRSVTARTRHRLAGRGVQGRLKELLHTPQDEVQLVSLSAQTARTITPTVGRQQSATRLGRAIHQLEQLGLLVADWT
jgi:hypothetical protein